MDKVVLHHRQEPLTISTCVAQSSVLLGRTRPLGYILQLLPEFINVGHLASFIRLMRKKEDRRRYDKEGHFSPHLIQRAPFGFTVRIQSRHGSLL